MTGMDSRSGPPPGPLAERLDRRVITLWRLGAGLSAAAVVVVAGVAAALVLGAGAALAVAGLTLVVGGAPAWAVPAQRWRLWSFAVTDDAVELRHGLFEQVHSVVPHFRVQHIAIERGPLERWLGLARLSITTASAGSDTHVPGLTPERADAIRRLILDRTASGDAV